MTGAGRRGKFITLEGIEGSGKSLQMRFLEEELKQRGRACLITREPGGTALGRELRAVLLHRDGAPREPISELLLYLADRYQHLHEVVEPALEGGRLVICDRYHDATLAYQGRARGIGFERIDRMAELLQLRPPDLTIFLDIDVETGLARARRREQQGEAPYSRFEQEAIDFHRRVREGYLELAGREPGRIRKVDASGTPEEVFRRVWAVLEGAKVCK